MRPLRPALICALVAIFLATTGCGTERVHPPSTAKAPRPRNAMTERLEQYSDATGTLRLGFSWCQTRETIDAMVERMGGPVTRVYIQVAIPSSPVAASGPFVDSRGMDAAIDDELRAIATTHNRLNGTNVLLNHAVVRFSGIELVGTGADGVTMYDEWDFISDPFIIVNAGDQVQWFADPPCTF